MVKTVDQQNVLVLPGLAQARFAIRSPDDSSDDHGRMLDLRESPDQGKDVLPDVAGVPDIQDEAVDAVRFPEERRIRMNKPLIDAVGDHRYFLDGNMIPFGDETCLVLRIGQDQPGPGTEIGYDHIFRPDAATYLLNHPARHQSH